MATDLTPAHWVNGCLLGVLKDGSHYRLSPWPAVCGSLRRYGSETWEAWSPWVDVGLAWHRHVALYPPSEAPGSGHAAQLSLFPPDCPRLLGSRAESADAWRRFLGSVPRPVLEAVARFDPPHHRFLLAMTGHPLLLKLVASTPVLAYSLVHIRDLAPRLLVEPDRDTRSLLAQRQRAIAGYFGFPPSEASVRLLRKLPFATITVPFLYQLRRLAALPKTRSALGRLSRVNAGAIGLLAEPECRPLLTMPLLKEVASRRQEDGNSEAAVILRDIARMSRRLGQVPARIDTVAGLAQTHHQLVHVVGAASTRDNQRARPGRALLPRAALTPETVGMFPPPPLPGAPDGSIEPVTSEIELEAEARSMQHCVAEYRNSVLRRESYIYRVLRPERATVELRPANGQWHLAQIKGVDNAWVRRATQLRVLTWIDEARRIFPTTVGAGRSASP